MPRAAAGDRGALKGEGGARRQEDLQWRDLPVAKRLEHALIKGIDDYVIADTEEARLSFDGRCRSSKGRSWTA